MVRVIVGLIASPLSSPSSRTSRPIRRAPRRTPRPARRPDEGARDRAHARGAARRHLRGGLEARLGDRGLDPLVRREDAQVVDPVAVERRQGLEHGQERHLAGLVAGDRGLVREPRLREEAVGVDGGHPLGGAELRLALARAEPDLRAHRLHLERGRATTGLCLRDRGVASPAVEGQGDADAGLPHGIEAAAVHVAGLHGEVGLEVALREVDRELLALDAGGPGAQLGKGGLGLRLQRGEVARLGPQGEVDAGDGVTRHLAPDEARELGQPRLDVGLLLRAQLLEAGDLQLGAEDVLLRALAHGVARARNALGLLPDVRLLVEHFQAIPRRGPGSRRPGGLPRRPRGAAARGARSGPPCPARRSSRGGRACRARAGSGCP